MKFTLVSKARNLGFTMIELLIVIAILGILAVAVLAAINPIEQINRGRDTGNRSDAEQLISAIDRFSAFQGFAPWANSVVTGGYPLTDAGLPVVWDTRQSIMDTNTGALATFVACPIAAKLSTPDLTADPPDDASCIGTDELKSSYMTKVHADTYNHLFIYNQGSSAVDSTYVCFIPVSGAFQQEARTRCDAGMPNDMAAAAVAEICGEAGPADDEFMICLP